MDQPEPLPPAPKDGARVTESDEETVLGELYGPPDEDGVYRGEASDGDEDGDQ